MKKLRNILMMSLAFLLVLGGTAFADASRHESKVIVSEMNAEANDKDKVHVNIYLRGKGNYPEKDTVFIATDRGSVDQFWVKKGSKWEKVKSDSSADVYYISKGVVKATVDKKIELGITSHVRGDVKVAASLKDDNGRAVWQYLQGNTNKTDAEIIPVTYKKTDKPLADKKYHSLNFKRGDMKNLQNNEIEMSVLNKDKKEVKVDDFLSADLDFEVITKPEGAKVKFTPVETWKEDLKETGKTTFNFFGDKVGKYEIEATLKLKFSKSSFNSTTTVTSKANFELAQKEFGATLITMRFDSKAAEVDGEFKEMQIAPFLKDGRTFVPVRFVAESLGAEVIWNEDVQSIILDRPDKKLTMVIGNNSIVSSTGEAYITDVAPYIEGDTTVLPFRVVAEAFGAEVKATINNQGEVDKVIFYNRH